MFPALWSLFLAAEGMPPWSLLFIFTTGAFLMRSAGCAINDLADRDLDRQIWRTKDRPLAAGRLSRNEALIIFLLLITLAGLLALHLNPLSMILAPPALLLAVLYPFAKRFTSIPQAILGMAFGWGALMAWAAVRNEIGFPSLLIFMATVFWAVAYDTIYALMDKEEDMQAGVRSTAILSGEYAWLLVGLSYFLGLACLALAGWQTHRGPVYLLTLLICLSIFALHVYRVKQGVNQTEAFAIFKSNVGVGLIILSGIVIDLLFL